MAQYGDNIFGIVGEAMRELRKAGMDDKGRELATRVRDCQSYDEAVALVDSYLALIEKSQADIDREWDEYWMEQDEENA